MQGRLVTVTGAAAAVVLVDGTNGSHDKPIRCTIKAVTQTVFLGGADVDATHGYPLLSTDAPLQLVIAGEKLWAFTSTTTVVDVLRDGV